MAWSLRDAKADRASSLARSSASRSSLRIFSSSSWLLRTGARPLLRLPELPRKLHGGHDLPVPLELLGVRVRPHCHLSAALPRPLTSVPPELRYHGLKPDTALSFSRSEERRAALAESGSPPGPQGLQSARSAAAAAAASRPLPLLPPLAPHRSPRLRRAGGLFAQAEGESRRRSGRAWTTPRASLARAHEPSHSSSSSRHFAADEAPPHRPPSPLRPPSHAPRLAPWRCLVPSLSPWPGAREKGAEESLERSKLSLKVGRGYENRYGSHACHSWEDPGLAHQYHYVVLYYFLGRLRKKCAGRFFFFVRCLRYDPCSLVCASRGIWPLRAIQGCRT